MTATPIQSYEQPAGFPFDSMDFAMSRSVSCFVQVKSFSPSMEDWEDEDTDDEIHDEDAEGQVVEVEIDDDLEDDGVTEERDHGHREDTDDLGDEDEEVEQYLHGDNE